MGWMAGMWLAAVGLSASFAAAAVEVRVLDEQGRPLPEAIVWVQPGAGESPPRHGVMDQVRRSFRPYILAVQVGSEVDFPNSDDINHHVYSFSPAKRFELRISPGDRGQSLRFDKAGLVTIGCNIHDWMLAYILVLDTPWFEQTDADGRAHIELPEGSDRRVYAWHPRIAEPGGQVGVVLDGERIELRLKRPLKPDPRVPEGGYR